MPATTPASYVPYPRKCHNRARQPRKLAMPATTPAPTCPTRANATTRLGNRVGAGHARDHTRLGLTR